MESIVKLCGGALAAVMAVLLVRQARSEIAGVVGIAAAVASGLYCVTVMGGMLGTATQLSQRFGVESDTLGAVFKIVGICMVCDFTVDFCRETGLASLASNVELAGKFGVAMVSFPLAAELLEMTVGVVRG